MECPILRSSPGHCGWEYIVWDTICCLVGKGVANPSSGECPKPFYKTAFIRISMRRGIQHTCIAYQSMSERLYSQKKKVTLSIDDNWRNTEIVSGQGLQDMLMPDGCKGLGSKEFTPYFMKQGGFELKHLVYTNNAITKQSKPQRIQCILQAWFPTGTMGASIGSCLPPAFLAVPSSLTGLFQGLIVWGYSLQTTQSGPQHLIFNLGDQHHFFPHPSPPFSVSTQRPIPYSGSPQPPTIASYTLLISHLPTADPFLWFQLLRGKYWVLNEHRHLHFFTTCILKGSIILIYRKCANVKWWIVEL